MDIENYTPEAIIKRKNKCQQVKKIFSIILYVILIPIIVCNLFLIIQSIFLNNKTASVFGFKSYVIISGSMSPKINVGDIAIVKSLNESSSYRVGDIISYRENSNIVTHRIIRVEKSKDSQTRYITKGDNNNAEDNFVIEQNNIEGKVIKIIPKLGLVSLFIENNVFLITIGIFLYAFISSNIKKIIRRKRREKKRMEYITK